MEIDKIIGRVPERYLIADVEGGTNTYAKLDGHWFSINGTALGITDLRWRVAKNSPLHKKLDKLSAGPEKVTPTVEHPCPRCGWDGSYRTDD